MIKEIIDTNFDFTTDTPFYWNNYWDDEMGKSSSDPDINSLKLREFHKILWSKKLPNGDFLNLQFGSQNKYLIWKDFCFGSDSITVSFRYEKYRYMIKQVIDFLPDYKSFIINYIKTTNTIGGFTIFPKQRMSINQIRGINPCIKDRFDLTLECIRKFYLHEDSPLYKTLLENKPFFDLFIDFKGYVDFFFLNDLVTNDYLKVKFMLGNGNFNDNPLPQSIEEYLSLINQEIIFVKNRNTLISNIHNA